MPSNNQIYPEEFSQNKMVGMVWSFKADHATWFGAQEVFIHGIQMIPILPV
jgi:endoglucanase Acf2